jgi:hypothetical protein
VDKAPPLAQKEYTLSKSRYHLFEVIKTTTTTTTKTDTLRHNTTPCGVLPLLPHPQPDLTRTHVRFVQLRRLKCPAPEIVGQYNTAAETVAENIIAPPTGPTAPKIVVHCLPSPRRRYPVLRRPLPLLPLPPLLPLLLLQHPLLLLRLFQRFL